MNTNTTGANGAEEQIKLLPHQTGEMVGITRHEKKWTPVSIIQERLRGVKEIIDLKTNLRFEDVNEDYLYILMFNLIQTTENKSLNDLEKYQILNKTIVDNIYSLLYLVKNIRLFEGEKIEEYYLTKVVTYIKDQIELTSSDVINLGGTESDNESSQRYKTPLYYDEMTPNEITSLLYNQIDAEENAQTQDLLSNLQNPLLEGIVLLWQIGQVLLKSQNAITFAFGSVIRNFVKKMEVVEAEF